MTTPDHVDRADEARHPDRRAVLLTAGVAGTAVAAGALLTACGSGSSGSSAPSASSPVTVPTSTVPVGGGVVLTSGGGLVVVQPAAGTYKAYSSTCPHMGCAVSTIANGEIQCPCHGSTFKISDGSVVNGPATTGLTPRASTVHGADVVVS